MADIRGIPTTPLFQFSQLTALPGVGAGFTPGAKYWPLGMAYDNTANVIWIVTVDDNGKLVAQPASAFSFTIQGLRVVAT